MNTKTTWNTLESPLPLIAESSTTIYSYINILHRFDTSLLIRYKHLKKVITFLLSIQYLNSTNGDHKKGKERKDDCVY